jgi:hypothetical protein
VSKRDWKGPHTMKLTHPLKPEMKQVHLGSRRHALRGPNSVLVAGLTDKEALEQLRERLGAQEEKN